MRWMRGLVNGLQNRVHPFESGTHLKFQKERGFSFLLNPLSFLFYPSVYCPHIVAGMVLGAYWRICEGGLTAQLSRTAQGKRSKAPGSHCARG